MEIKRFFLLLSALFFLTAPFYAEGMAFPQKIEWKSNANALEYKVEVQNLSAGKSQSFTTDKTSAELSLSPGRYRYRVHAYDFLGKESSVSSWTSFEVFKANKPKIAGGAKNVQVPKNGGSLSLDLEISDINENTQFELVSESLQGTITADEKALMKSGSSETEKITHLDFKNVPPGKWRLRVTNSSGLSSLSDVINVDGEKLYTDAEVSRLRSETEDEVRKKMQKDFDEYLHNLKEEQFANMENLIQEYEEEKRRREEEKERLEQERLEQERQLELARQEAERKEKEEEKRRLKEEKKVRGYQWKDVIFEGGLGLTSRLYNDIFKNTYGDKLFPCLNIRLMFLPVKTDSNKIGSELCYLGQKFEKSNDFYDVNLLSSVFSAKIVWHHELIDTVYFSAKAGGGVNFLRKGISYSASYQSRTAVEDKDYMYPCAAGNLSLFINTLKILVFEAGVEYTHTFASSSQLGMLTPYVCAGFRF